MYEYLSIISSSSFFLLGGGRPKGQRNGIGTPGPKGPLGIDRQMAAMHEELAKARRALAAARELDTYSSDGDDESAEVWYSLITRTGRTGRTSRHCYDA